MAIPPKNEELLSMKALRKQANIPHNVRQIHFWCKFGSTNRSSRERIILDSVVIGGQRYSTVEAFDRFCELLTER